MHHLTIDQLRPALSTQFFVRPDAYPEQEGSILLPRTVVTYNPDWFPTAGRVVATGPAVREVKVGDRVRFERYHGKPIILFPDPASVATERYFVMTEDDIWGVEEPSIVDVSHGAKVLADAIDAQILDRVMGEIGHAPQ